MHPQRVLPASSHRLCGCSHAHEQDGSLIMGATVQIFNSCIAGRAPLLVGGRAACVSMLGMHRWRLLKKLLEVRTC